VDDILDHEGYANTIGISDARKEADALCQKAKNHLKPLNSKGSVLAEIADFMLRRTY
jgi:hypothetical protein